MATKDGIERHGEGDYTVPGNDTDNYVGVSPEYRNYANETEKPHASPDKAERKIEVQVGRVEERNQIELNEFAIPVSAPVEFSSGSNDPDADLDEGDDEEEASTPTPAPTAPSASKG